MMRPLRGRYMAVVMVLLLLSVVAIVYSRIMSRIPRGEWGGVHVSMNVGEKSATIEYDCAKGVIEGPLAVNDAGEFNLRGSFTSERGGPVRADETPREQGAAYSGTIKDNTMTLTLKIDGEDDSETFTLEKGKTGKLMKCK
jgi:hypothetical protein